MLHIDNVSKSFATGKPLFTELSLDIARGEYIAIMGESGSGKSTLLNLIAGLDTPDSGRIEIDGRDVAALDDAARTHLRRSALGFVFQAFHLLPHLSIERNVALPLALNGKRGPEAEQRVIELLSAVGLIDRRSELPNRLSGGEMQRVAVARALVHRPKLVLADEPTGNLDADSAAEILELLKSQLIRDEAAGILVTHSNIAAATTQRTYCMTAHGLKLEAVRA